MTVMVIENAQETLRGELTKWMLEVKPGVFVGVVSALVRAKLWEKVEDDNTVAGAVLIYNANTEQGFKMDIHGYPKRSVVDLDGVQLIKVL